MIAVGVISIATVVLGIQFKNVKPEYGILLSITGCLIIFYNDAYKTYLHYKYI